MKMKFALAARILLGLIFVVFGLNGFFTFIPIPPMPEPAMAFMKALGDSGYMLPMVKIFEIVGGLMLLSGCFVPLALIILAPGIYNILLFHAFLAPEGLPLAIVMVIFHIFLVYFYWPVFCGLLVCKPDLACCDHDHEHEHQS